MPRSEAVIPPQENVSLDITEMLGEIMTTAGSIAVPGYLMRRGAFSPLPSPLFTAGGATLGITRGAGGAVVRAFIPGAAQTHTAMAPLGFPIGRDQSLIPAALRVSRRYIWEVVFETNVQLAGVQRFVGFRDDATQIDAPGGGIGLRSLSTENGGAWTLKFYLTNGGVLQTGVNTGIVPAAGVPQAFQFIYRDSTAPQFAINLNGVRVVTLDGLVNLPALDGNEPHNCFIGVGAATNPGLGETDYMHSGSRFVIQEIDPMPAVVGV